MTLPLPAFLERTKARPTRNADSEEPRRNLHLPLLREHNQKDPHLRRLQHNRREKCTRSGSVSTADRSTWNSWRFAEKPQSARTGTNRMKSMKPGEKIRTIISIRSQRTGLILPRDGIFIGTRENIGRTLILVDFGEAGTEYLLSHEIEEAKKEAESSSQSE